MNGTTPKLSLAKLGLYPKPKTLKVMVLGQAGVGKSGKYQNVLYLLLFDYSPSELRTLNKPLLFKQ